MKVTFLGTGTSQGVPVIACDCKVCLSKDSRDKRLRTSVLIEVDNKCIVIDTGPDFRQQMLRAAVKKLDAVVFTHSHKDHTAGLDDVRGFNFKQKKPIDVYATTDVQQALKREFAYVFAEHKYPGIPKINLNTINNQPFFIEGIELIPIEVWHYKLPVMAFRIKDFTYITDANYISETEKQKVKGSKVIVLNALRREKHVSHYTLDEAVELVNDLNPQKGYLVHISHQMGLHTEVNKIIPKHIQLAYDGLKIEL
ncbi:MAG: MBL fold metallo-hydrolase [Bacteroidetes bacterium]|nr:MBL fold metallo-hydrolase [Bacteroidota bacterium]